MSLENRTYFEKLGHALTRKKQRYSKQMRMHQVDFLNYLRFLDEGRALMPKRKSNVKPSATEYCHREAIRLRLLKS